MLPADLPQEPAPDALGSRAVGVPQGALWGAQTERARRHFAIGEQRMPDELIRALVLCKAVAAAVNARLGTLDAARARAIEAVANTLLSGQGAALLREQFPLSPWQSGSGTQTNMNVNEVLATLAAAGAEGQEIHPNDHVNRGQSSNDIVPTAMHLCALQALRERLLPALDALAEALAAQGAQQAGIVKLGRTHLQDAVPLRLADEIGAWRSQLLGARESVQQTMPALSALAVGATAVGTGLNTHPSFACAFCAEMSLRVGFELRPAADRFAAVAGHEPLLALHGALRLLAVVLTKIANDVRLLSCGPRGGIGELRLPANEPGSSIMPGKVNPTQCEALLMVCCQVFGNDVAVTAGAAGGLLQLNTFKPLIAVNVLSSLRLLADAMGSFALHAVRGLVADRERIGALLGRSLMLVTALAPHLGYDQAAAIAQRAHDNDQTLRDAALALGVAAEDFDRWVDPVAMAGPA